MIKHRPPSRASHPPAGGQGGERPVSANQRPPKTVRRLWVWERSDLPTGKFFWWVGEGKTNFEIQHKPISQTL
ncbi:MAG: hypothetical protein U5M51_14360 [Emticicia sp.]|nr:hypothetical protein [Emticicia sp.]